MQSRTAPTVEELTATIKLLQQQLQKKDELIAAWSHDINGPIVSLGEMITWMPGASKDQMDDLVETFTCLQLVLDGINKNVLHFGHGSNVGTLSPEVLDVRSITTPLVKLYNRLAASKDRSLLLEICEAAPAKIVTDKTRLYSILINFITNAIRYSAVGSSITLKVSGSSAITEFAVTNYGPGIPYEYQNDIFLPHVRLSPKGPGLGIGLTNCRSLSRQLHGVVSVTSVPDDETTFRITLPTQWPEIPA